LNLPNKLSIARMICIPVIVVLLYFPGREYQLAAGIVFILASLTDFIDGRIARSRNLVTDFGKFIDPLADKLLVLSTLVMLVQCGLMDAWIPVLILCRELAVDGLRMIAVTKGKVIAASPYGKIKTTCQMILITAILMLNQSVYSQWYMIALMVITVIMTVISAVDYFRKNASVFSDS